MNIDDFIISSKILLEKGQFESALCLICCAIDACANSKYRNIKGNRNRICNFSNEYMSIITQFGMPVQFYQKCKFQFGKNIKGLKTDNNGFAEIEDIIYFCIRCGLIHETCVSPSLIFSNDLTFTYHDGIMFLQKTLILGLIEAVEVFRRDEDNT